MTKLHFTKGHGTANDFILIKDPHGNLHLTETLIRELCNRRTGIGADGLIRAIKSTHLPEGQKTLQEEPEAQWFMDYHNADGTPAEMCGNGARVYAHYLLKTGLAKNKPGDTLPIGTRAGIRDILQGVNGYTVDLGRWRLGKETQITTHNEKIARPGQQIHLGNPHTVTAIANQKELDTLNLTHPPKNTEKTETNYEFALPAEPLLREGVGRITMRVHERGVGETQSCGTGAAAAALAYRHWGGPQMPNHWQVKVPGGTLAVRMFATEEGEHVSLSGPATLSYTGEIEINQP